MREWLWWPPGTQPRSTHASPQPHLSQQSTCEQREVGMAQPTPSDTTLSCTVVLYLLIFRIKPTEVITIKSCRTPTSETGCFPDEFYSSDLQHHLKQAFIIIIFIIFCRHFTLHISFAKCSSFTILNVLKACLKSLYEPNYLCIITLLLFLKELLISLTKKK